MASIIFIIGLDLQQTLDLIIKSLYTNLIAGFDLDFSL